MRFFDLELIGRLQLGNESAEDQENWDRQCRQSFRAAMKAKNRLPDNIINICKHGFFHDSDIEEISVRKIRTNKRGWDEFSFDVVFKMLLYDFDTRDKTKGTLTHKNVTVFKTSLDLSDYIDFGNYRAGEIYTGKRNELIHNILLWENNEVHIKCQSMEWEFDEPKKL